MADERLIYRQTLKDGRVRAVNAWRGGFQELVYPDKATFEAEKQRIEDGGTVGSPARVVAI